MKRIFRRLRAAAALVSRATFFLALAGCPPSGCSAVYAVVPLSKAPRPLKPRPIEEVEVFMTTAPSRPYVEVAEVVGSGGTVGGYVQMYDMRRTAAEQGCDGLVMSGRLKSATANAYAASEVVTGLSGICIVYKDEHDAASK